MLRASPGTVDGIERIMPGADIEKVFTEDLLQSDYVTDSSEILIVAGHPDVIVRIPDAPENMQLDELEETAKAYEDLGISGVNVLPYLPVQQGNTLYVVTQRVKGVELNKRLEDASPEIIEEVEVTWVEICKFLAGALRQGKKCPSDAYDARQYMYGQVRGDEEEKIWLVDLDFNTHDTASRSGTDYLLEEIFNLVTKDLQGMERRTGTRLDTTRKALEEVLENIDTSNRWAEKIFERASQALETGHFTEL